MNCCMFVVSVLLVLFVIFIVVFVQQVMLVQVLVIIMLLEVVVKGFVLCDDYNVVKSFILKLFENLCDVL